MLLLQKRVEEILRTHGLYHPQRTILAACSGGTDSLALLDILISLRERDGARIVCAHYDHGIRGEESRGDALFVENFCRTHDILCVIEAGDVPRYARMHKHSIETAARICRYDFLRRVCAEHHCDVIAVAHHADDLAETVLMRILRGTGLTGLAAMRVRDGDLVRPLLSVTRAEIEAYAAERGLMPRHDATNDAMEPLRNRVRHQLMPLLAAHYNPAVRDALTRLSILAAEEDDLLAGLAAKTLADAARPDGLSLQVLRSLHPALQRRVLRLFWARETGTPENLAYVHGEDLRRLLAADGAVRCVMPRGYCAYARYGRLVLQRAEQGERCDEIFLPLMHEYGIINFQGVQIELCHRIQMTDDDWQDMRAHAAVYANLAALPPLVLRMRRAGDYMHLPQGRKKLKDIFIDDKIPREQRDSIPLLALAETNEIFWVVGGRRSTLAPVAASSSNILKIVLKEKKSYDE